MVLARLVDEIPDLELAHVNGVGTLVMAFVHERLEADRSCWLDVVLGERLDVPSVAGISAREGAAGPTRKLRTVHAETLRVPRS